MEEVKNIFKDYEFNLFAKNIFDFFDQKKNGQEIKKYDLMDIFNAVKWKDAEDLKIYKDNPQKIVDDPPIWFLYQNIYKIMNTDYNERRREEMKNRIICEFFNFLYKSYKYEEFNKEHIINIMMNILGFAENKKFAYLFHNDTIFYVKSETKTFYICQKFNSKLIYETSDTHHNQYFYYSYVNDLDKKIYKFKKESLCGFVGDAGEFLISEHVVPKYIEEKTR